MYSYDQLVEGIKNPHLVRRELEIKTKKYLPHDIGVQGSYYTGNIGDEALGKIFKSELETNNRTIRLFPDTVSKSNSEWNILGGGGVLHDWYGIEPLRKRLKYVSGGGLIAGVGSPGIKSEKARHLVSKYLPKTSLITVRDERSKRRVQNVCDVDVTVTADPAFLYNPPPTEIKYETGVNFRPWFIPPSEGFPWSELDQDTLFWYFGFEKSIDINDAFESYVNKAQHICENLDDPVYIPFHKADEEFAKNHLDINILEYTPSVRRTLKRINSVRKVVASRYHSLVFAALCGKPVHALTYAPKVEDLSIRLDVPHSKIHRRNKIKFDTPNNVDVVKSAAEKNFELIEECITRS